MMQLAPNSPESPVAKPGEAIAVLQHVSKIFKDFWMRDRARAVDNVSIEVRHKEIFGLLGPNGSGKSTTIKMILGLLKPTHGRVSVFGKMPTDVSIKKRIGYLPEESYMYAFLNARETLDYYGKLFELDHSTRQRRIDELLDMIGLTNAQYRPVREYSKGMQRRIGIAQALINDPDFLILDEPTTGLDPLGTRQVKDLILELGRRGKTILLSSHLLADVEDVVDRMVILYGGQIRAQGTCDELLTKRSTMAIETDPLDDATVAEVERVIRQRTSGSKAIQRVTKPRQRLEDLFLEIVEQARAEQATTSGATSGGETAAFLKADEGDGGRHLIDKLMKAEAPAPAAPVGPVEPRRDLDAEAKSVIDSLVLEKAAPAPQPRPVPAPVRTEASKDDVDLSIIGNLLGGEKKSSNDDRKNKEPGA